MAQMTPLRRRMIDNMTGRNLSPATQQSYVSGEPSSAVSSAFRWIPYITLAEGQEPVRSRRRPGGTESSNPLPSSGESVSRPNLLSWWRNPAFRAGVCGWLGDGVGRDA